MFVRVCNLQVTYFSLKITLYLIFNNILFSTEGLKSQVARHSLNYIQEIGNGWFGKVKICLTFLYLPPDHTGRVQGW